MSDQQIVQYQVGDSRIGDEKWMLIVSADDFAEARRFGVLRQDSDPPHFGEVFLSSLESATDAKCTATASVHAPYAMPCELIAVDRAELTDVHRDDDDDEYYDDDDDDDDPDSDLDEDDDVFFDDDDDLDDDYDEEDDFDEED